MVTVIVACFNQAKFLPECLHSLINQSYKEWECIIVDDGSTDRTAEVISFFCSTDKRFSTVYQNNSGVAAARNTGLKLAKGAFIQFLDGDDILQSSKLESQVLFLQNNSIIDVVYGSSRYFYEDTKELFPIHYLGFSPTFELHYSDVHQQEVLLKTNVCTNCAALYRSTILEKGIYFKHVQFEDWLFNIACSFEKLIFHYAFFDNSFSLIRMNPNSLMLKHLSTLKNNQFEVERKEIISIHNFSSKLKSVAIQTNVGFSSWYKLLRLNFLITVSNKFKQLFK